MPIITSRADLNQGAVLAVASAIFATGTGADIRIHTSASNLLPALAVGEFFEVRDHSQSVNNGLYIVVTVTASTDNYEVDKVTAGTPIVAGSEAIVVRGAAVDTVGSGLKVGGGRIRAQAGASTSPIGGFAYPGVPAVAIASGVKNPSDEEMVLVALAAIKRKQLGMYPLTTSGQKEAVFAPFWR